MELPSLSELSETQFMFVAFALMTLIFYIVARYTGLPRYVIGLRPNPEPQSLLAHAMAQSFVLSVAYFYVRAWMINRPSDMPLWPAIINVCATATLGTYGFYYIAGISQGTQAWGEALMFGGSGFVFMIVFAYVVTMLYKSEQAPSM